mgnify:CR=1 FL=1
MLFVEDKTDCAEGVEDGQEGWVGLGEYGLVEGLLTNRCC